MHSLATSARKRIQQIAKSLIKKPPIVAPLILVAVLYTIFHRTPNEFFEESFPIAVFLAIISYGFFSMRWSIFGLPKFNIHLFLLPVLYLPLAIIALTVVYYGIWGALQDGYIWVEHQSPPRGLFVAFIGVVVAGLGYALFLFRLHVRFFFGLTEAVTGLVVALRNIPENADPVLWSSQIFIVILTAGIFLIVRGFDNMCTGLQAETRDSFLKEIDESEYGTYFRALRGKDNES
ncbi:MAG: hypothetical protein Q7T58_02640 [Methylotenera sp.]|nr:hypothetical protein [Methylotenera sp.]